MNDELQSAIAEVKTWYRSGYRAEDVIIRAVQSGQLVTLADRDAAVGAALAEAAERCKLAAIRRGQQLNEEHGERYDAVQHARWRAGKLQAEQLAKEILTIRPDATAALERVLTRAREVKPLEWFQVEKSRNGGKYTADGYTIRYIEGLWLLDFAGQSLSVWRFPTLEAAKAAAQADYAARITSALVP